MEPTHRKSFQLTSLTSLCRCAVLTGWYWASIIEGSQWTTSGRSFVIPGIFCDHAVYVSIWVIDAEEAQVKFVSHQFNMAFAIPGNTLQTVTLSCDNKTRLQDLTSAYSMTSSRDVSVYAEYSLGGVRLRPSIALGSTFFVPHLPIAPGVNLKDQQNFIAMTSISDNTNIELRFPVPKTAPNLGPFTKSSKGEFYTLKLRKLQTAFVRSADSILGVRIESGAHLLVMAGKIESSRKADEKILLIEELPAAENYGKEYFVYAPKWLKDDVTVYVSGLGTSTNFTLQNTTHKSKLSISKFGSILFRLSKGDFAFVVSRQTSLIVIGAESSQDNPSIALVSIVPPLIHYTNLANLKLPSKELNDSYTLITNFQQKCNQSVFIRNLSGLTSHQIFANISGRTFSASKTDNETLLESIVNDTKTSGSAFSSRGFVYRSTRGVLRSYPFPMYSFPVVVCRDATQTSASGSNPPATTPALPNYLRGNDLDDDCDGRTDEELLNGKDDDGDGLVDEDVVFGCVNSTKGSYTSTTRSNVPSEVVKIATKSPLHPDNSYYHVSIVALVVSLALALWAVAMLLGGSLLWEYHRRECARRSTSVSPIFHD